MFVFKSRELKEDEVREIMKAVIRINYKRKKAGEERIRYTYRNNKTASNKQPW